MLSNDKAFGEAVNVMGDEVITWNAMYEAIALAAGLTRPQYAAIALHVPSDAIVAAFRDHRGHVYGDKIHTAVYNRAKLHRLVPDFKTTTRFADGIRESIAWYEANPERQEVDAPANSLFDDLSYTYRKALRDSAIDT